MKRKILAIIFCTLFITTMASFSATAIKCERKPQTHIINSNSPPEIPTVDIPENVVRGHWLFIKVITTDPDGDNVYYKFDISGHDYGWVGPFQSGKEHTEKVILLIPPGTYTLAVQAKDMHGAESDCSYSLFNVIKSKQVVSPISQFLQNHPNLLPIFKFILEL